jgi:hypothetical protein
MDDLLVNVTASTRTYALHALHDKATKVAAAADDPLWPRVAARPRFSTAR